MSEKQKILVVHLKKSVSTMISELLSDMGFDVVEAEDGADAIKKVESENIKLVISYIFVKTTSIVRLIKSIQKIKVNMETIVLCDKLNSGTSELLRNLGVYRILNGHVNSVELEDAVISGLSSKRIFRMAVQEKFSKAFTIEKTRMLLAHPDDNIFENVLKICLGKDFEINGVKTYKELTKKLSIGAFDVLAISQDYLRKIIEDTDNDYFPTIHKPAVCIISFTNEEVKEFEYFKSHFPIIFKVNIPINTNNFLIPLNTLIKKQKEQKEKAHKKSFRRRFLEKIHMTSIVSGSMIISLYLLAIIAACLVGFFASRIGDTTNPTGKKAKIINMEEAKKILEEYRKLHQKQ